MAELATVSVETVSDPHWADAWLYAVMGAGDLSPGAKNIAALLRLHLNAASWTSSPSVEGLAARSTQTTRAVEKQRDALAAAGFIDWQHNRGRVRNEYRLIVTPNVRRELARIYPEHTAVVEGINPEPVAGVEQANPEQADGVEKTQPRTMVRATPNGRCLNPERTAGQTRKPVKPVSGSAPRAPDGAAVAARFGDKGDKMLARMGSAVVAAWFDKARWDDGIWVVPSDMYANHFRGALSGHLDAVYPEGWSVRVERQQVAA
jgi:hypothetical protein